LLVHLSEVVVERLIKLFKLGFREFLLVVDSYIMKMIDLNYWNMLIFECSFLPFWMKFRKFTRFLKLHY